MKTLFLVLTLTLLLAMIAAGPAFASQLGSGDPGLICPDQISGGLLGGGGSVCDPYRGDNPACRPWSPFCPDFNLDLLLI